MAADSGKLTPLMRIVLAGYNIDAGVLQQARELGLDPDQLTPEILSAAYARISRNPAPVDQLRLEAAGQVAKARASNERIVFGLGHASVAEHAVFNFDVIDVSRLAIEAVEHFRLCSYTEKSQRYIRLQDDYVLPDEVRELGLEQPFRQLVELQNRTYHELYSGLRKLAFEEHPDQAGKAAGRRLLEGLAKEDARYVTSLATCGQLGLTANARNMELICRRLSASPLAEVRAVGAALLEPARQVAPSLIRYPEPTAAEKQSLPAMRALAAELGLQADAPGDAPAVKLVRCTPDADSVVAAGLLAGASGADLERCRQRVDQLDPDQLRQVLLTALGPLSMHDTPPRAFELATLGFELTLSAACHGQLKRHRMATVIPQPYDPALGTTMPAAVERAGLQQPFAEAMEHSEALYHKLAAKNPAAAPYALTQAHRRRVQLQLSARELYHFARLRQDQHAQWDIRQLADQMLAQAREKMPLTLMLACGKDAFTDLRASMDLPAP